MTKVYCEKDGNRYTVCAQGHAAGSPEVCAAVSGLLYALAGYAENEKGALRTVSRRMESGDVSLTFRGGERAEAAYDMAVIGLMQIEKSCPAYIRVERREIS